MKEKVLLEIQLIKSGDYNLVKKINDITEYQISFMNPKTFNDNDSTNHIRQIENSFETVCTNLEELGVMNPKKLTVFEFYSKMRYFKEKNRARK